MDPQSFLGNVVEEWRKAFVSYLMTGEYTAQFQDFAERDLMCRLAILSYCESLIAASQHGHLLNEALPAPAPWQGKISGRMRGPRLNIDKLGLALKEFYRRDPSARPRPGKRRDTCASCSRPVWLDRQGGKCEHCGKQLDGLGNPIRSR